VDVSSAQDNTPMGNLRGIGDATLKVLGAAGYPLTRRSTLGDFRERTGSIESLMRTLDEKGVTAGYSDLKLRALWETNPQSNIKRARTVGELQDGNLNPLIAPSNDSGLTTGDEPGDPQLQGTNGLDHPEVHALTREAHPEKAVATGLVSATVTPSVVPDVLQVVSIPDKAIANPNLITPEQPVSILPSAAVNPGAPEVARLTQTLEPESVEEKQFNELAGSDGAQTTKANQEGDIGSDGRGDAAQYNVPESTFHLEPVGTTAQAAQAGANGMMMASQSPEDAAATLPDKARLQREKVQHPFKKPPLGGNYDKAANYSRRIQTRLHGMMASALATGTLGVIAHNAADLNGHDPYTLGVRSQAEPSQRQNSFLDRSSWYTSLQYTRPSPLFNAFDAAPIVREQLLDKF
jgi:hypothetical protein